MDHSQPLQIARTKIVRFVSACSVQRTDLHRGGGGNRNATGNTGGQESSCFQMIGEKIDLADGDLIPLNLCDTDAKDMLALATLTNPGPFAARTNRLGEFIGLRRAGHLAAMAGEQMKPDAYTEISEGYPHPDYRARGDARKPTHPAPQR